VSEAQKAFIQNDIEFASLDHDLGICESCIQSNKQIIFVKDINCAHNGTGYDLVKWMAETNNWPNQKPTVHSMNSVGRQNMMSLIERYFPYK
jgi:hypothetical protein